MKTFVFIVALVMTAIVVILAPLQIIAFAAVVYMLNKTDI